jgi:glycogen operon protein
MSEKDWNTGHTGSLGVVLPGDQITETNERGERILGDNFAVLFNANQDAIAFRLGTRRSDLIWTCILDTAVPGSEGHIFKQTEIFPLQPRSLAVLRADLGFQTE